MKVQKIDVELEERIESGPTQFGDDWPGVFIRGDSASHFAHTLRRILSDYPRSLDKAVLESLASLLESSFEAGSDK